MKRKPSPKLTLQKETINNMSQVKGMGVGISKTPIKTARGDLSCCSCLCVSEPENSCLCSSDAPVYDLDNGYPAFE